MDGKQFTFHAILISSFKRVLRLCLTMFFFLQFCSACIDRISYILHELKMLFPFLIVSLVGSTGVWDSKWYQQSNNNNALPILTRFLYTLEHDEY